MSAPGAVDLTFRQFHRWEFEPGPDLPWLQEQSRWSKWPLAVSVSLWQGSWRMLLPLMRRPGVSEILIGGANRFFVETRDGMVQTSLNFDPALPPPPGWDPAWRRPTKEDLADGLGHIHRAAARREVWRPSSPLGDCHVEANLEDRSRLMGLLPPASTTDEVMINVRRFSPVHFSREDFLRSGTFTARAADTLDMAVQAGCSTIFAAGTGCGKTTLLEFVAGSIPEGQVPLTIEDTPELNIQHPLIRGMKTRERPNGLPDKDHFQAFMFHDGLRASLRARPDWIIAGEIRDASDPSHSPMDAFINALQSGHAGMTTLHAHDAYGAMMRCEALLGAARPNMREEALRLTLGEAIRLLVVMRRDQVDTYNEQGEPVKKTLRRVFSITEVLGSDGREYHLHNLFRTRYHQKTFVHLPGSPTVSEPVLEMVGLPFFGLELEDQGRPLPSWWHDAKLQFLTAVPRKGRAVHGDDLLSFAG